MAAAKLRNFQKGCDHIEQFPYFVHFTIGQDNHELVQSIYAWLTETMGSCWPVKTSRWIATEHGFRFNDEMDQLTFLIKYTGV